MPIHRPCLTCHRLTINPRRCDTCQATWQAQRPKPYRPHYRGNYAARAKAVRETATQCWICGEGARVDDPWTADHVHPGDTSPDALLLPAHRTCNSRRGNRA
jgi:5-methylcytosine-specific restriction protein A